MQNPNPDLSVNEAVLTMRAQLEAIGEIGQTGGTFPIEIVDKVISQAGVVVGTTNNMMGKALVELATAVTRQYRSIGQPPVLSLLVGNTLVDLASTLHEPILHEAS